MWDQNLDLRVGGKVQCWIQTSSKFREVGAGDFGSAPGRETDHTWTHIWVHFPPKSGVFSSEVLVQVYFKLKQCETPSFHIDSKAWIPTWHLWRRKGFAENLPPQNWKKFTQGWPSTKICAKPTEPEMIWAWSWLPLKSMKVLPLTSIWAGYSY